MKWCVAFAIVGFLFGPAAVWWNQYAVADLGWRGGYSGGILPICMVALAWRWRKSQNAICPALARVRSR
jgi:hypothetical protein